MSDTALPKYIHYGTNAERLAFVPAPPATGQPIYIWYETDTGDTYVYDTTWHLLAAAGSGSAISALTGDVTATGPGSAAATIAASAVTNAKMANMADQTIKGNDSGGAAAPQDLTANEVSTVLDGATDPFVRTSAIGAGGITELTGDVTAGPGSGTQAATIAAGAVDSSKMSTAAKTRSVNFVIDGGGSAITTGVKGDFRFPVAGTITKVSMLADVATTTVVDIWKDVFGSYPPVVGDSITSATPPTITSPALTVEDTTLASWITSVAAGDCFRINVNSNSAATRLALVMDIQVTG